MIKQRMGDITFWSCENLTNVVLPDSLTAMGDVFNYCGNLTNITIPKGVIKISPSTFNCCDNLKTINIAPENTKFASYDGCIYNKNLTTMFCCPGGKDKVIWPDSISSIDHHAFSGVLTNIIIPKTVTDIDLSAFHDCDNLVNIDVSSENNVYASYEGCLYNKNLTTLLFCPQGKDNVTLSDSLISLGSEAFYYRTIQSIEIPSGVTSIEGDVFWFCHLNNIIIPASVTYIDPWYGFFLSGRLFMPLQVPMRKPMPEKTILTSSL